MRRGCSRRAGGGTGGWTPWPCRGPCRLRRRRRPPARAARPAGPTSRTPAAPSGSSPRSPRTTSPRCWTSCSTGVHSGRDVLALLTVDGATAGFAASSARRARCGGTGRTVLRVQVHPSRQGAGARPRADGRRARHRARRAAGVPAPRRPRRHRGRRLLPGLGYDRGRPAARARSGSRPGDDRDEILLRSAGSDGLAGWGPWQIPPSPGSRDARRERLVGLLVLGVAARPAGVVGDLVRHAARRASASASCCSASSSPRVGGFLYRRADPPLRPSVARRGHRGGRSPARRPRRGCGPGPAAAPGSGPAPAPSTSGTVPISVPPAS